MTSTQLQKLKANYTWQGLLSSDWNIHQLRQNLR